MNALVIGLVLVCIAVSGIILYTYIPKTTTNAVLRLSATAEITPGNIKVHTLQDLSNVDSGAILLDNSTLDKIPVLKNAIDQAFGKFTPPPLASAHTFTTYISQSEVDSILKLADGKVEHLPETQTNDTNFGVSFTTDTSSMEFKLNNFYYHVTIEQMTPS
ncbi:MAG: hypothetical protein KGH87_07185 [Thaumarchaeota archaeon]|nr:hypothetical protein [Nitrososphaerota archaeon]MDE1839687.1 hypothetical protein [Nitrososphaerota archaeon]